MIGRSSAHGSEPARVLREVKSEEETLTTNAIINDENARPPERMEGL